VTLPPNSNSTVSPLSASFLLSCFPFVSAHILRTSS
jgi:hypothetical protein